MQSVRAWIWTAVIMAVIDLAILGAGLYLDIRVSTAWLAWAVSAIAVVTFIGSLILVHKATDDGTTQTQELRAAITGAFVIVYLVLLGLFAFRYDITGSNGKPLTQSATTSTLIHSFTILMATIIGFYFATTAAEHISSNRNEDHQQQRQHEERMAAARASGS